MPVRVDDKSDRRTTVHQTVDGFKTQEVVHVSPRDTIVESPPVEVLYVAGDSTRPIAEQAPLAVERLESSLTSLRGKKFYGVVVDGEYRACVQVNSDADIAELDYPKYVVPGGRYVHRRLVDWDQQVELIGQSVAELCDRVDFDPSRPVIEFYRSHSELVIKVPVI